MTRFIDNSLTLHMRNLPGTSHRTAAGSVDLPRHQGEPSIERHVVSRASYPAVTSCACLDRQLSVAQQVAVPCAFLRRVGYDKTRTSFAALTTRRSTRYGQQHVSHNQCFPSEWGFFYLKHFRVSAVSWFAVDSPFYSWHD
jgi:hypothetical protein